MSIKFAFKDEVFSLDKLQLPSRHYLFNDNENYIKLLNIGEGIFPKDKIKTLIFFQKCCICVVFLSISKNQ